MHIIFNNPSMHLLLCLALSISFSLQSMDAILKQATALVEQYKANPHTKKPIIAIAGASSVGKTHLSEKLHHALSSHGVRTKIVPLDYFFNPRSKLEYALEQSEFNSRVGHPVWQFDHRDAHRVLRAIATNQSDVVEPRLDFETKATTLTTQNYTDVDLVIVEGIYALSGPNAYNLAQYSALKIFMDADTKQLLDWYCTRKRNKGHPNPEEDPVTRWDFEEDYAKVIAPTKANADIVLLQSNDRQQYDVADTSHTVS